MKPLKIKLKVNIGDLILTQDNLIGYISEMYNPTATDIRTWFTITWFGEKRLYKETLTYHGILQAQKDNAFQHIPVSE